MVKQKTIRPRLHFQRPFLTQSLLSFFLHFPLLHLLSAENPSILYSFGGASSQVLVRRNQRVSVGSSEEGFKKVAMEGSGSGTGRRSWLKDDFTDLVLSWSLEEIFDENLYKYQVGEIPQSFESVDQYLGSYVFPLLEETRAELASALETVYKAPFAEVTSFNELKGDKLQYHVKVDHWRNRKSDGKEPYRTLPGDVVLLSDLKPETGEEYCDFCPLKCNSDIEVKLGLNLFSNLNDSQIEAISASLLKTECNHKSSVELIWGPPGTGKTTTLSILLYTLLKMNVRTLICAPTNVAIKELASRLIALVRNSVEAEYEKSFFPCPLGDMLIFGNKDRLKVGSDIEEISLDYRLERLSHCLVPQTGWRHCVATMLGFLEDCVSQYQIYMDNELIKAKESLQHEVQSNKSFLEFARDSFAHSNTSQKLHVNISHSFTKKLHS
ncbi:Regulator of nonsense transcripts 1 [Sesamum angolense]|uniref:Regulator of nonsense transcripts 1 n=1 Tax=Sesamum angolense TaxID=2727404 RepID=A0AAE2C240_9LAMI|nr:Regulator of nonsense transcripts 1 [Sesamum angolense]